MQTENSELTNRLTEAAMRASEAEAAQQQVRARASQAASAHDDPLLNSSGSRPSSPTANGSAFSPPLRSVRAAHQQQARV